MQRRHFLSGAAAAALPAAAADSPKNAYFELRYFHLRTGPQNQRTSDFLHHCLLPAAERLQIGPLGFFSPTIGEESPFILALISYPSLEAFGSSRRRLMADKEYRQGWEAFNAAGMNYIRMENALLRAFDGLPHIAVPPSANRPPLVFELRTYESGNEEAGQRKIRMFNEGEIRIFQRLGFMPVFFGETLVGRNLPSLTYMLSYESMTARDRLWNAFGNDQDWQKLRAQPGYSDAEIVSNISNAILRPLAFSPIR
jgi:NIPSNAP